MAGNDLATFPDFPAEIRAPAGSLPGVSGFQLHFADHDILTPGDQPDVLVAMNPAALKTNLRDLPKGGTLIVDTDAFTDRNLKKAGYESNPIEDGSLEGWQVHAVQLTSMTVGALKDIEGVTAREAERAKNMFALGLMSWLYGRTTETTKKYLQTKFAKRPEIAAANLKAFDTGYAFGETSEGFAVQYEVKAAPLDAGPLPADHRQRRALVGAARRVEALEARRSSSAPTRSRPPRRSSRSSRSTRRSACARSRPRTRSPPSARRSARRSAARSASRPRPGPGVVLKSETVGLAIALELPLLIIDVQRAGPSTGMPTKPEQGDLLMVLFGRNSESPVPVIARVVAGRLLLRRDRGGARRADLPHAGLPALATRTSRTAPSRGRCRTSTSLAPIDVEFAQAANGEDVPALQARPGDARAAVGDPRHAGARASHRRAREGERDGRDLLRRRQPRPDDAAARAEGRGREGAGPRGRPPGGRRRARALVGRHVRPGARRRAARARGGGKVAHAHLRWLNPFPANLGDVLRSYDKVLIPEMNLGQLLQLVRARYLVDAVGYNRVTRQAVQGRARSPTRWRRCCAWSVTDAEADREGLQVRPGGPLVPGLRRLRDPRRGAELHAGARARAREDRLRLGHRLRGAVPVLHADLRHALDPRPRARDRDRPRRLAPRSVGVGGQRRRRRAVDRRQPPDPRAAPQREHQDPDVQQPDLRPDEGPVLADERAGQGDGLDADGQRRLSVQPALASRSARRRRSSRARSTPTSRA